MAKPTAKRGRPSLKLVKPQESAPPPVVEPTTRVFTIELPQDIAKRLDTMAESRGVDVSTLVRVSLHNLSRRSSYYDLDTRLGFGKYADENMEMVIRCDPSYISWCLKNLEKMQLSERALALPEKMERPDRMPVVAPIPF